MPRLLDLFCGAGGCTVGYQRAGFNVTGADIEPHPDYPATFVHADAMELLADADFLSKFDAIHASPPCQASTTMSNRWRGKGGKADEHVNLIPEVIRLLEEWGGPWVVENVPGARSDLPNAFTLTGGMFGLGVHRPRLFASNELILAPLPAPSPDGVIGVYGSLDGRRLMTRSDGSELRAAKTLEQAREAMGIDWMSWADLTEAVPPAYTEWIGRQLLRRDRSEERRVIPSPIDEEKKEEE